MLWAVLAVVVSTPPIQAKVASTYDEAACADAARPDDVNTDDTNCSEPPPAAVPAVLDCNDARVSLWLGEMIGSCDMPRPQPPTGGPAAVRAAGPNGDRLCSDGHCGLDAAPLRAAPRLFDDSTVALATGLRSPLHFPSTSIESGVALHVSQLDGHRLERPPRSV